MKTSIEKLIGRRIWDSRGRPTVEVDVVLEGGARGRGVAPAGASRGSHEAIDLRDGGALFGGFGVAQALANINGPIAQALLGFDALGQATVDRALIELDGTPNKSKLGGNATIATSLAVLDAAAASTQQPLWKYLAQDRPVKLPLPQIQIFGGGAHAARRVDIQDFLVMPLGAQSFDEALCMTAEVYRAAGNFMANKGSRMGVADEGGWWPDFASNEEALEALTRSIELAGYKSGEVMIALDIAASEFGKDGRYKLGLGGRDYDTDGWLELVNRWVERFPIISIEDPVAEDDDRGMRAFTESVGDHIQVVGDDFLVTNAKRVLDAEEAGQCNAVLIKPNQAGTVTETHAALLAGQALGWGTIVSARSGETEDVAIVHLATGWNAGQLKVGSFARSERMAKWNEGLRIEEELGRASYASVTSQARHTSYAGRAALPIKSGH